jgi:uncharacterized protein YjaZ
MEPTAEEMLKHLVKWHERVEKEDKEHKVKREAEQDLAKYALIGVLIFGAFGIGVAIGYQIGYIQVKDIAIQVAGQWIRVYL